MASTESLRRADNITSVGTMQDGRVYHREWKKYRPYLQKSTSLPSLQLLPHDRPVFSCLQCGFTNSLGIPLCPWCLWTSESANQSFESTESKLGRLRRVSAPPRVFWKQSDLSPNSASPTTRLNAVSRPLMSELRSRTSRPMISSSDADSARPGATRLLLDEQLIIHTDERHPSAAKNTGSHRHWELSLNGDRTAGDKKLDYYDDRGLPRENQKKRPSSAVAAQLDGPPVVIVSHELSPASSKGSNAPQDPRRTSTVHTRGASSPTTRPRQIDSTMSSSSSYTGVDRLVGMSHIKTTSMQSLRSAHLVIDIKPLTYGTLHPNDPLNLHDPARSKPTNDKTLRRTGRISVFRTSDSTTGMTSVFETESEATDSRPASLQPPLSPVGGAATHSRSKSQPANIPLGHPNRPYYTAIRPNKMSPPASSSYSPSSWGRGRLSFQPPPPAPRPTSLPNQITVPSRCASPGIFSVLSAPCLYNTPQTAPATPAYLRPETPVLDPATLDAPPSPHRSHFGSLSRMLGPSRRRRPAGSMGLFEPTSTSSPDYSPVTSPNLKIQHVHVHSAALAGSAASGKARHHPTGFSLSGETELKMALASAQQAAAAATSGSSASGHGHGVRGRGRSRTVAGDEFRFQETPVHRSGSIGNVARRVREGFKEFVRRRGLSPTC